MASLGPLLSPPGSCLLSSNNTWGHEEGLGLALGRCIPWSHSIWFHPWTFCCHHWSHLRLIGPWSFLAASEPGVPIASASPGSFWTTGTFHRAPFCPLPPSSPCPVCVGAPQSPAHPLSAHSIQHTRPGAHCLPGPCHLSGIASK